MGPSCPRCGSLISKVKYRRIKSEGWIMRRRICRCGYLCSTAEIPMERYKNMLNLIDKSGKSTHAELAPGADTDG